MYFLGYQAKKVRNKNNEESNYKKKICYFNASIEQVLISTAEMEKAPHKWRLIQMERVCFLIFHIWIASNFDNEYIVWTTALNIEKLNRIWKEYILSCCFVHI